MSEILKREDVSVDVDGVVVVFRVAKHEARFSYPTAFDIAQRLRLCANGASRNAGIPREERADMKRQDPPESLLADVRVDEPGRMDGTTWDAWIQGELVAFLFGNMIAKWEAPAAMTIASWFREGGRQAKHNAGDRVKTIRIAGTLTDASKRLGA